MIWPIDETAIANAKASQGKSKPTHLHEVWMATVKAIGTNTESAAFATAQSACDRIAAIVLRRTCRILGMNSREQKAATAMPVTAANAVM